MRLTGKYLFWLVVPPAAAGFVLSFFFLSRVVQFTPRITGQVALIVLATYGIAGFILMRVLAPLTEATERAIQSGSASVEVSRCFEVSQTANVFYWIGSGLVFAFLSTWFIQSTLLGFTYFLISSFIVGSFGITWGYFISKKILVEESEHLSEIAYSGREIPLGRKVAIVFIGFFIISSLALVQLVSSKVATSLEEFAINNDSDRFDSLMESASVSANLDADTLSVLEEFLPEEYDLFLVSQDGSVLTGSQDQLGEDELGFIRRAKSGNSLPFISQHVSRFDELPNGDILVMTIPWTPFADIPNQIAVYTLIVTLVTTIIFFLATYFLSRDVTRPLNKLQYVAKELASGNFATSMNIFSDDEVGDLAARFRDTRENLRGLIGRVGGSGATITDGVRVITGGTEALLARSGEQATLTEQTTASLDNVRKGSSSVLSSAESVTEITQDASSRAIELQAAAEEVARNMDDLFGSVDKTSSSVTQMDASAREMTGRTEFLANIGEEVLSFVAEMDSTIRELRQTAQTSADISREVREDAEVGGTAVNQTVDGIRSAQESTRKTADTLNSLQKSIGQISQILNVIEDITERTNLLSLNAAIIAAQAGEMGLGFSVVADEIRELAERTKGSTNEIGGIIKAVQAASKQAAEAMHEGVETVDHNVALAQNTSESLTKILQSAGKSYEIANKMSSALEEQMLASQRLHEVTSRMSDHITEINRTTQEQARGTRLLAEEADRVRDIALQVKNSTDEQSVAGRGISEAMEQIAQDVRSIRDLLQQQLDETGRISEASQTMLGIAQENQAIAEEFTHTVKNLAQSAREFESEVSRFKVN